MSSTRTFIAEAREAFGFLEGEPGYSVEVAEGHGGGTLTYRNATTAVLVELSSRGPGFSLLVGPLDDGGLPSRPAGMLAGEAVGWFPLWLVMRSDGQWPPSFSFSLRRPVVRRELREWAEALARHAGLALRGEFSELRDAAALLRAQAELRASQAVASPPFPAGGGTRLALGRAS